MLSSAWSKGKIISYIVFSRGMLTQKPFCTVGSPEKVDYLVSTFDIPRSDIFNSRDSSFLQEIMKATNGRGVDIVLNSLSGNLLHASWQCVAEYGTMVEIGKRDFLGHGQLAMDRFEYNRTFLGVDYSRLRDDKPWLARE